MRMMTTNSLMRWRTRQDSSPFLLTLSTIGTSYFLLFSQLLWASSLIRVSSVLQEIRQQREWDEHGDGNGRPVGKRSPCFYLICIDSARQIYSELLNISPPVCQFDELSLASNSESLPPLELEPLRQRRTRIPDKPNYYLNLWSIMKNCIGKELSKIPMPVRKPPRTWDLRPLFT